MRRNAQLFGITSILLLASLICNVQKAFAQDAVSLGVFPPILEITAVPPASVKTNIEVSNLSENPANLKIVFRSFVAAKSADGKLEFLPEGQITGPDSLIFQKIQILDGDTKVNSIQLQPFESKTLTMHIGIGKEDPLGDYYFSIIFLNEGHEQTNTSSSTLPAGIGTNVLLSVGPKGKTNGQILDFRAPFFVTHGPLPFTLLFRNTGDHFIAPTGEITIKNIFGKTVGKLAILPQYVLAQSSRYLVDDEQASLSAQTETALESLKTDHPVALWQEKYLFGLYQAKATITLDGGPTLTKTIHFFALPVPFIAGISLTLVLVLSVFWKISRKDRSS